MNSLQWKVLAWTCWINSAACGAEMLANGFSWIVLWVMLLFAFFAGRLWDAADITFEEEQHSIKVKELHARIAEERSRD